MLATKVSEDLPLGTRIPPGALHGISVSLPRWSDCVRYEEGDPQVLQALQGGYPRFVLHPLVLKLSDWVARTNGTLSSLLFNSAGDGERAKTFVLNGLSSSFNNHKSAHQMASLVELIVEPGFSLQALLCHEPDAAFLAKEFWQHTGTGISTRLAEYALQVLGIDDAKKDKVSINWTNDALVKETLCSRIAGILNEANESRATESHRCFSLFNSRSSPKRNSSINQVTISSKDIHLFPSGMAAIYTAHQLAMRLFPSRKSVQFGFPYVDTLKLQQKMGPGVSFYGNGSSLDLDELTLKLQKGETISAVFCEFPSNPLFKTPDLVRLSKLAKEFGCLLIVDDTLASFANVSVLECADMVVSSLTKMFSGAANVMAGSCIINPLSPFYAQLSAAMSNMYEDALFPLDALVLEENSRDFLERSAQACKNAEILADHLVRHPKVESLYYPKYIDTKLYTRFVTHPSHPSYGPVFSILFPTESASSAFYDALHVSKGPSLGSNFTLVCPYTILAHYWELDAVEKFGVEKRLVRVSVGLEDVEVLKGVFERALEAVV